MTPAIFSVLSWRETMLSACNPAGRSLVAWEAIKDDGPFTCPECRAPVLLRKGEIKIHHFAHIPPTGCQYGTGESEVHRQAKMAIYQSLLGHSDVTRLKLERSLQEVRPDVSCLIRGMAVAIEVQISHLSLTEIRRRTQAYASKNIAVLWTPPYVPILQASGRYTPRIWEKSCTTCVRFFLCFHWAFLSSSS